jgi:hypothetical protein
MKKNFYLLLCALLTTIQFLTAQVNIVVSPDSVHVTVPNTESEINLPSYITNNSGDSVTIRWTRVIEEVPQDWSSAFCDKNVCWFGTVSSKTFQLIDGETGLLKPIFYPYEMAGTGVMRVYYISETPGVVWADTAVYIGVATGSVGVIEAELVRDVALFPNPANDVVNIVTADAHLQGQWCITDAAGKIWDCSSKCNGTIAGQIPVAHLPVGLYLLHVLTPDGQHVVARRFALQR